MAIRFTVMATEMTSTSMTVTERCDPSSLGQKLGQDVALLSSRRISWPSTRDIDT